MSQKQNEEWLEDKYDEYYAGDIDIKEAIIAELKENGFKEEAEYLEEKAREKVLNEGSDKEFETFRDNQN